MATKNISITESAYRRLAHLRRGRESFSQIITRVTCTATLLDLHGILADERGLSLEKAVREEKKKRIRAHKKRTRKLAQEFD